MVSRIFSSTLVGLDCVSVCVEVDLSMGLPGFHFVGLPDASVHESCDRVRSALRNSGHPLPARKITVNLAPGDQRKEGPRFDLAVALGVLVAEGKLPEESLTDTLVLAELALDGTLRPVRGVLSAALQARSQGLRRLLVAPENAAEATLVRGLEVLGAPNLKGVLAVLLGQAPAHLPDFLSTADGPAFAADFCDVAGQAGARRALEIAAAGGHHVILIGPPGCGKTMMARTLPSILPPLEEDEALEVARVSSAFPGRGAVPGLPRLRPFQAPGHSCTPAAILGSLMPGEVSRAHHGVLFLDEFAEYSRSCLEGLRTALEEGEVEVTRARFKARYPARFQLVAAMNPCPCGYHGDPQRACQCSAVQRRRYLAKLSGPLRDRLDLHILMRRPEPAELLEAGQAEPSASVCRRVLQARARQQERGLLNSQLSGTALHAACALAASERRHLQEVLTRLHLSPRACSRILRTARTIADLEGSRKVERAHLGEAVSYRALDRAEGEAA